MMTASTGRLPALSRQPIDLPKLDDLGLTGLEQGMVRLHDRIERLFSRSQPAKMPDTAFADVLELTEDMLVTENPAISDTAHAMRQAAMQAAQNQNAQTSSIYPNTQAPPPPPTTSQPGAPQAAMKPAIMPAMIPPAARKSDRTTSEVRARRIGSGWLVYADGAEVEVATDATLGAVIAGLAAG